MITNFELQTAPLTKEEKELTLILVLILNKQAKPENPLNCSELIKQLYTYKPGYKIAGSRLRKMIHYISVEQLTYLPLVAGHKGYWLTNNPHEIENYIESLWDRIFAIQCRAESIKKWKI
jgi:hypothetical protein